MPAKTTVYGLLKHPLYAGAYGRRTRRPRKNGKTCKKSGKKYLPPHEWKVLIKSPDKP